jgi:hypothetical protein
LRNTRDFAVAVLALGLAGVIAGVLWSLAAPRPPYVMTKQGPLLADPTTQALIAADGWFVIIAGALGLACGAIGYSLSRRGRPLAVVLGLTVGGLLGSYIALVVGRAVNFGGGVVTASGMSASLIPGPLTLTAQGVLLVWPVLAVGLFFTLEGIAGYRDSPLRRPFGGEDPYGPLSAYDISDR